MPYPAAINWANFTNLAQLDGFTAVIQDDQFWASLWRTVIIAGLSATIAVSVATILAYAVARGRPSWRLRVLDMISSASIAIPAVIAGFSAFILYLVVNRYVPIAGTIWALVLAYSYRMSIAYRVNLGAARQIKMELEEAAWASGASRLETFRRVVLPLLLPTMSIMWIALFVLGAHEFTLAVFLATPDTGPLSTYVYSRFSPNEAGNYAPAEGAAAGLVFTAIVLLLGYGLQVAMSRRTIARSGAAKRRSPARLAPSPSSAP
jgi:iron(III) transport system permease protein